MAKAFGEGEGNELIDLKKHKKKNLKLRWLLKMGWRDGRRNLSRLFLFVASIIVGITALVGINSFADNLSREVNEQSKELLGADIRFRGNDTFSQNVVRILDSLGGEQAEELNFVSMAHFPRTGGTRLVEILAMKGNFPFYGEIETNPASAAKTFRNGQNAIVDRVLKSQYGLKVGDSVQVGEMQFRIEGFLIRMPGSSEIASMASPAVIIPKDYAQQTGLIRHGSRLEYAVYLKLPDANADELAENLEPRLEAENVRLTTALERQQRVAETISNFITFLNLIAFIALLLGCVGVASSVNIYAREKIETIAVLRCLGASSNQAFLIFLLQISIMGLAGAIAGAVLGSALLFLIPGLTAGILPVDVEVSLSWPAIAEGIIIGLGITILFSLLPLLAIRNVSPLNTLRASYEAQKPKFDMWRAVVIAGILLLIFIFTRLHVETAKEAAIFTTGVVVAFLILAGMGKVLMWLVRKFFPVRWSYLWRQALANLYRPNNQTLMLTVSIGLGTGFIAVIFFTQSMLLQQINVSAGEGGANMILFNIQSAQVGELREFTRQQDLLVVQEVPIVTIELESIKGMTAADYAQDTTKDVPSWLFTREYRVTYRDRLTSSETLLKGEFIGEVEPGSKVIPVSVDENFAEQVELKIGDTMVFNVQGNRITTMAASFRKVDWSRMQTNFWIVFPKGVLEKAPQFYVITTRVPSTEKSASFQQALVGQFPNVSAIDISLIIETVTKILDKISMIIQFMGLFSIITGFLVLISSVSISKYHRIRESVLLRTLGASRKQILLINALEYFFIGGLASITGIVLALLATWALSYFSFKTGFSPDWLTAAILFVVVTGLTIIIGMFNSRSVVQKSPLEVLRQEV